MNATGAKLRVLLPTCPICGRDLGSHSFCQVASTVVNASRTASMTQFFSLLKQHEWSELASFNDWESDSDNLVAYVIKGERCNGVVVVIKDVFELYQQNEIVSQETLSAGDVESIAKRLFVEWHAIPRTGVR